DALGNPLKFTLFSCRNRTGVAGHRDHPALAAPDFLPLRHVCHPLPRLHPSRQHLHLAQVVSSSEPSPPNPACLSAVGPRRRDHPGACANPAPAPPPPDPPSLSMQIPPIRCPPSLSIAAPDASHTAINRSALAPCNSWSPGICGPPPRPRHPIRSRNVSGVA